MAAQPLGRREYVGATVAGRRFTLRSEAGRLTLLAPPRAATGEAHALAAEAAAALDNDKVYWRALASLPDGGKATVDLCFVEYDPPGAVFQFVMLGAAAAVPALLAALDDPARFAAAHVMLMGVTDSQSLAAAGAGVEWPDLTVHRRGGQVVLRYGALELGAKPPDRPNAVLFYRAKSAPVPDAAQIPALRNYWHDRVGVAMASTPHAWVVFATALPPLAWCLARVRRAALRRRRVERGGCAACGYALTGNVSGVCPECGTAVRARPVKASGS